MMNKKLLFIMILFLIFKSLSLLKSNGQFQIKMFDVGQGDAIYVRTPQDYKILIDGGPDYEIDRYLDKEFFLNGCRLDLLVLTHPHQDHIKGLNRLFLRCEIGAVIYNPVKYKLKEYEKWKDFISQHSSSTKVIPAKGGDVIRIRRRDVSEGSGKRVGLDLIIIWPESKGRSGNINNASVSFLLDYGEFEALFLGDLEREASSKIDHEFLEQYLDGRLEIYKVPHHGSKDSHNLSLVNLLKPELCLVSVGEGNKFNHPHEESMSALEFSGCRVLRTDYEGTIEVLIN